MSAEQEIKEWVKVATSNGKTTATVSLVQGNLAAKYAAPCFTSEVKDGIRTARVNARRYLREITAAITELDNEEGD